MMDPQVAFLSACCLDGSPPHIPRDADSFIVSSACRFPVYVYHIPVGRPAPLAGPPVRSSARRPPHSVAHHPRVSPPLRQTHSSPLLPTCSPCSGTCHPWANRSLGQRPQNIPAHWRSRIGHTPPAGCPRTASWPIITALRQPRRSPLLSAGLPYPAGWVAFAALRPASRSCPLVAGRAHPAN